MHASELTFPRVTARRVLVLVHGYATSIDDAQRGYERFLDRLSAATALGRVPGGYETIAVYWPGDDPNRFLNKLTFASRVAAAEQSGDRLATCLADYDEVVLVGHSLGCRVVLQTLVGTVPSRLASSAALLLAAAVPEEHCGNDGVYAASLMPNDRQAVLYSVADRVLRFPFRPGMRMARPGYTRAVGRTGGPTNRWLSARRVELDHGEYWAAHESAEALVELLQFDADHAPMERARPLRRAVEESRAQPARYSDERVAAELIARD